MAVEVKIPEVGESITEGFLAEWSQPDGAVVAVEDPLLVLETDKITMTVNSKHAGRLQIMVAEGETVEVGQIVATIDTDVTGAPAEAPETAAAPAPQSVEQAKAEAPQPKPKRLDRLFRRLRPPLFTAACLRPFSVWSSSTSWIRQQSKAPERAGESSRATSSASSKHAPRTRQSPNRLQPTKPESPSARVHNRWRSPTNARPALRCRGFANGLPKGWWRYNRLPPS
jgi:pyruvate/2-oxoglutarate dehydrogenase complex dihydrolipoamide acyltransferase (E2) component